MNATAIQPEPPTTAPWLVGSTTLAEIQPVVRPAGTILFRANDPDDRLFVILNGSVAFVEGLGTDEERIVWVRGAGELVGELSVLAPERPNGLSARVHKDAYLLELHRDDLDAVLRREPLLAYEMVRIASGHLQWAHRQAVETLEEKNTQLAAAYTALQEAQAQLLDKERLQHELRLARELQERMLPATLPVVPGFDIGARIIPAYEVGGDFYDVFVLDQDTLGFVIGDVCGKSMSAALYMAQTRSLIRAEAPQHPTPEAALRRVNDYMRELNTGDMFATAVFGRLDAATRTIVTARAGHEYPLAWDASGRHVTSARATGQPLGVFEEPAFDMQTWTMAPGDTLLLYTDGVTDVMSPTGEFFDGERLQAAITSAPATTAQGLCDHIVETLLAYRDTAAQFDDITLMVVRAT